MSSVISTESEIPDGIILSAEGGVFFNESSRIKDFLVIELPGDEKVCCVYGTEAVSKTVHMMQLLQKIKAQGYKIAKREVIDEGLLRLIYEKEKTLASKNHDESAIIADFDEIVKAALFEQVSDIHIGKRSHNAYVKMRKHGQILEFKEIAPRHAYDLCSVAYNVLAEEKDITFNERDYQSCSINRVLDGVEVKLRYQSLPVYPDAGFDVVLRVLPIGKDEEYVPLETLGYAPSQISMLMNIVSKPVGALVIAGTTGSGKSTTLKNLLMYINESRGFKDKIYTVEDPPEYKIPRVSQIPVIRRKDDGLGAKKSPFEDPIVACMRADPDILMIGEVRDGQTGDLLKKAVQSGHQVLTTLHAASALAIVDRFTDFSLNRSVLGSQEFISGLCYQKLVPLVCPHCSIDFKALIGASNAKQADMFLFERLSKVCDVKKDTLRARGAGCEKCSGLGVIGRTVCAEIIAPDFEMLEYFRKGESGSAHKHWRSLSDKDPYSLNMIGKSALEHGMVKMRKGMVTPHDLEDAFGLITKDTVNYK